MDGRAFLQSARHLLTAPTEANRRAAAGRAYYALLHEGRAALERWGFPLPPNESLHRFVRLRFVYAADADLRQVGDALDRLGQLRNQADYQLANPGPFASDARAAQAVALAQAQVDRLDQIEADPVRRAAAIAAIRTAWP
jgi:hypothetical protein